MEESMTISEEVARLQLLLQEAQASQKQMDYLDALARRQGHRGWIDYWAVRFAERKTRLTSREASRGIDDLRQAAGRPSTSKDAMIRFLGSKLARGTYDSGWYDSDLGQTGARPPSRQELQSMSPRDLLALIDELGWTQQWRGPRSY